MTDRQQVVALSSDDADSMLGPFIADVLELAGLFRRVAGEIAKQAGQTQSRWYALSVFSAAPLTVSQAARRLGTTRQAVQRTANELLADGLAVTQPNPDHRGSPYVVLTPNGHETLSQITMAAAEARQDWFSDTDAVQLKSAHEELRQLRDSLREKTRK